MASLYPLANSHLPCDADLEQEGPADKTGYKLGVYR